MVGEMCLALFRVLEVFYLLAVYRFHEGSNCLDREGEGSPEVRLKVTG